MENSRREQSEEVFYWIEMRKGESLDEWLLMHSTQKNEELEADLSHLQELHPEAVEWRMTREERTTISVISVID